jgi:hypothetical protein
VTTTDAAAGAGVPGSTAVSTGSELPATGGGLGALRTAAALLAAGVAVTAVARAPRPATDAGDDPAGDPD